MAKTIERERKGKEEVRALPQFNQILRESMNDVMGIAALLAVVPYVTGFFIASVYLSNMCGNVGFLSFVHARYVMIGMCFLVYASFGPLFILFGDYLVPHRNMPGPWGLVLAWFMMCFGIWLYMILFFRFGGYRGSVVLFSAIPTFWAFHTMLMKLQPSVENAIPLMRGGRRASIVMCLIIFVTSALIYAVFIYPQLSPLVGGGRPTPVTLLVEKSARDALSQRGIKLDSAGWTQSVGLLDSTADEYILSVGTARKNRMPVTASIRRDAVSVVLYQRQPD